MWNYHSDVLVLKRLPPKALGRFRCVSKSWNKLISSSEFIRSHLKYQSSIQKEEVHSLLRYRLLKYSVNCLPDLVKVEAVCEIQPPNNPDYSTMMVGSCNGLISLIQFDFGISMAFKIYGEYEIVLCNPISKSKRVLPKNPMLLLKDEVKRIVVFYGFGYDNVHDTYKVFLATAPLDQPDPEYVYEVYSLRSDKWMIVSSCHDRNDCYVHCPRWNLHGALINNALHWIIRNRHGPNRNRNQNQKNYILAFDLISDQLNVLVPLPEATEDDLYDELVLSVANGCLLLANQTIVYEADDIVDMWLMKEYGLKDSWTRIQIRNSSYNLCNITPVALLEVDDDDDDDDSKKKLIYHNTRVFHKTMLLSYDVGSHQVVELPPPPPSSAHSFVNPIPLQYVGSLVHPYPPSS